MVPAATKTTFASPTRNASLILQRINRIYFILLDRKNVAGHILSMLMDPQRARLNAFAGRTLPIPDLRPNGEFQVPYSDALIMTGNNENSEETNQSRSGTNEAMRLFPGRLEKDEFTWWERIMQGSYSSSFCKLECENYVKNAFKKHPILKILKGALKNAGCPLDFKRHIVCEDCDRRVQGGYDYEHNQIVVCKNLSAVRRNPETILIHELIHMYDHCVNEMNFKNVEHLACTEIRAANLAHCSFLSSWTMGQSSPFNVKKTHQYCVKARAAESLATALNLDTITAIKYVLRVFDKCYNDLEPVGRRVRRKSLEGYMAEEEAKCFNISEEEE